MRWRRLLLLLIGALLIGASLTGQQSAQAHGGVVIKSGSFEHYEWLVQVYPVPTPPGVAVVTFFIFDYNLGGPAMEFEGELQLGAPGENCCDPTAHGGPYPLLTDPVMYPGDYTAYIPLTEPGTWQLKFILGSPSVNFETSVPLEVQPGSGGVDVNAVATQVAVMNAAALAIQQSAQAGSPLATPDATALAFGSPLALVTGLPVEQPLGGATAAISNSLPSNFNGWIWGGMAAVVVLGSVISIVRVQREE
jgi:hypothetical protein